MRTLIKYILAALIMLPSGAHSQELLSEPNAKKVTRIPFRMFNSGVMMVSAALEGFTDTLNFIFDTGSGGISLDSATCSSLKLVTNPTDTSITGIGGIKKVHFVFNQTLNFPSLKVPQLNFHVNNYDVLSSVYGEHIDGIIGYGFLSRYIVEINFDSLWMDVFTPGKFEYPSKGQLIYPVLTTIPFVNLQVKDHRRLDNYFYFDTGAGLCFLMSERYVKDSSVLMKRRKPVSAQAEGMLGRLRMRQTIVKEIKLGQYKFRRIPTYLYDDTYNVTAYPFSGGLIGNEILRRFNVILNYGKRHIHLSPNSHFNDTFDYSYTGLGMYSVDGKIIVGEVVPSSPAAKAGLKQGDIVIAVENDMSGNIHQYRNILKNIGEHYRITVIRENMPVQTVLTPVSIK